MLKKNVYNWQVIHESFKYFTNYVYYIMLMYFAFNNSSTNNSSY